MNTSFAPNLFVKNISKNVSKQMVWNIFNNYGFGIIQDVMVKPRNESNSAIIIYEKWHMEETKSTRIMLESGKALTITNEELNATWKVNAYNNMERFEHLFVDSKLHPNITDNRKERQRNHRKDTRCYAPTKAEREENQRYAEEFLHDMRVKLF